MQGTQNMMSEDQRYAEERCSNLTEAEKNRFNLRYMQKAKKPAIALIISIFLGNFGVDRFYLGQIGVGLLKLFLNLIIIGIFWTIVDWFLILGATRQANKKIVDEIIAKIKSPAIENEAI